MELDANEKEPKHSWWLLPREQAVDRLAPWPLFRQLLVESRFRYAFATCAFVVLLAAVGIPRIWIVSPKGFYPTIRISWLDFLEARLYRRLAIGAEEAGNREQAWNYWRQACSHHPTSLDLLRHSLSNAVILPTRNLAYFSDAMSRSSVLAGVSRTNTADYGLMLKVLGHYRLYDLLAQLAASAPGLSPESEVLVAKSFLWLGQPDSYSRALQRWPHVAADPEIPLFNAALEAGWSSDSLAASQGLARLTGFSKADDRRERLLALQLMLLVTFHKNDTPAYETVLNAIRDIHEDEPLQHAQLWRMLEAGGRRARAVDLARKSQVMPMSSTEILGVSDVLVRLGLEDDAMDFMERYVGPVRANAEVWLRYAEMLVDHRRWDDLRKAAVDIRSFPHLHLELYGYSHFIEGLALQARGDFDAADANFRLVPQFSVKKPELAFRIAKRMADLGELRPAVDLALVHQEALEQRTDYWNFLVESANSLKDSALMLRAARRAYDLNRADLNLINNFAAALIITRADPKQLLGLTTALYEWNPRILAAKVNHSLALIDNDRIPEAAAILATVDERQFNSVEKTMVSMAKAELAERKSDWPAACSNVDQIDFSYLFPEQRKRLETLRVEAKARRRQMSPESAQPAP